MRVLVLAPFERGRGHGGSQRATAVAERLEDHGFEIGWQVIRGRPAPPAAKLKSLARAQPGLAGLYERPLALLDGRWDALIVAHSYLVPCVSGLAKGVPAVVDFHNLEWRHLADSAHSGRGNSGAGWIRDAYTRSQVALMRRLERSIARTSPLCLFVSELERSWAESVAPSGCTLLVPSVLPAAVQRTATAIHAARAPEPGHLAYVGTLTFPPNLGSLQRFLERDWPAMRAAVPGLRLTVAGACADSDRAQLERHPGVRALGFVDDLTPLLVSCQAVVMPFDGAAGTSLRALFYALADLPVIASPQAFRGLDFAIGTAARSTTDWVQATRAAAAGELASQPGHGGRARALEHQHDPHPWDRLAGALAELDSSSQHTAPRAAIRMGT